jgi:hypothetical protein
MLLRDKTNIFEFVFATIIIMIAMWATRLASINFGGYSLDGLTGFALLVSFAGLSTYRSLVPGIIIAILWGLLVSSDMHIVANIITVMLATICYAMHTNHKPMSPLNVYQAAIEGSIIHSVFTYGFGIHCGPSFILFALMEMFITMVIVKSMINKIREMGFINHEDPVLVAKIERDYLSDLYNLINKFFRTNFHRPEKPTK